MFTDKKTCALNTQFSIPVDYAYSVFLAMHKPFCQQWTVNKHATVCVLIIAEDILLHGVARNILHISSLNATSFFFPEMSGDIQSLPW